MAMLSVTQHYNGFNATKFSISYLKELQSGCCITVSEKLQYNAARTVFTSSVGIHQYFDNLGRLKLPSVL